MKIEHYGMNYTIEEGGSMSVWLRTAGEDNVAYVYFDSDHQTAMVEYYDYRGELLINEYDSIAHEHFAENIEENLQQIAKWLLNSHPEL